MSAGGTKGMVLGVAGVEVRGDASKVAGDLNAAKSTVVNAAQNMAQGITNAFGMIGVGLGIHEIFSQLRQGAESAHEFEAALEKLNLTIEINGARLGASVNSMHKFINETSVGTVASKRELADVASVMMQTGQIGGEVMERAMKASVDMAATMGTVGSNARMLGMALANPEQGMMRLRRAGVHLTLQQRMHIKILEESGQKEKAQLELLEAIEKTRAGMAERYAKTPAGRMDMAKKQVAEARRELGELWLPVEKTALVLQKGILETAKSIGEAIRPIFTAFASWNDALGGIPGKLILGSTVIPIIVGGFTNLAFYTGEFYRWLKLSMALTAGRKIFAFLMLPGNISWSALTMSMEAFWYSVYMGSGKAMASLKAFGTTLATTVIPRLLALGAIGGTIAMFAAVAIDNANSTRTWGESVLNVANNYLKLRTAYATEQELADLNAQYNKRSREVDEAMAGGSLENTEKAIANLEKYKAELGGQLGALNNEIARKENAWVSMGLDWDKEKAEETTRLIGETEKRIKFLQEQKDKLVKSGELTKFKPEIDVMRKDTRSSFSDVGKKIQDLILKHGSIEAMNANTQAINKNTAVQEQVMKKPTGNEQNPAAFQE